MDWLKIAQEGGIAVALTVAGIIILTLIVKWILEQFKVELEGNRRERVQYLDILHKIGAGIDEHNVRSKEFMAGVCEEHKEQQLEHKEMILILRRINGCKDEH
jgi:hypothetical protein